MMIAYMGAPLSWEIVVVGDRCRGKVEFSPPNPRRGKPYNLPGWPLAVERQFGPNFRQFYSDSLYSEFARELHQYKHAAQASASTRANSMHLLALRAGNCQVLGSTFNSALKELP